MKPIVAIIGRPNVGKSTLFNRLVGSRQAIVDNVAGLTRDRLYGEVEWGGKHFTLVDTGGLIDDPTTSIEKAVYNQVAMALEEADFVLFVVDGRSGPLPADSSIADIVRKKNKRIFLVINKIDDFVGQEKNIWDFYSLGFEELLPVSAEHGLGTGDLLDSIVNIIAEPGTVEEDTSLKMAVIGRPNVGKSSLVNSIIGEERAIVDDQPGTTRDAIDSKFSWEGTDFTIIDTAGLRRPGKIKGIEKYSSLRAHRAIERAEVVITLLDAETGLVEQDKKIAGLAHEGGKGMIIGVNKWDLSKLSQEEFNDNFFREVPFLNYAPVVFLSAIKGWGINPLLETVKIVEEEWRKRIKTSILNEVLQEAITITPPPSRKGKALKIYFATQVAVAPPTIILFVNDKKLAHFSYIRYLENQLRNAFNFYGSPIWIKLRQKGEFN